MVDRLSFPSTSHELLQVAVTWKVDGVVSDPTSLPVDLAVVALPSGWSEANDPPDPLDGEWISANWRTIGSRYFAEMMIGDPDLVLDPGTYAVFDRITAPLEEIVRFAYILDVVAQVETVREISDDDLALVRTYVAWNPPTDAELDARFVSLGSWQAVALEACRTRLARMVDDPASFSVGGEYSESWGENMRTLREQIADLEALVPAGSAGSMVGVGRMYRADRVGVGRGRYYR